MDASLVQQEEIRHLFPGSAAACQRDDACVVSVDGVRFKRSRGYPVIFREENEPRRGAGRDPRLVLHSLSLSVTEFGGERCHRPTGTLEP
nr:hypothetical protein [Pseudoclavibacter helvolus]